VKTKPIATPDNWQALEPHPLSDLSDFGAGIDIEALAKHMTEFGYDEDEAIILHCGRILDGRHRHRAAIKAGITPPFREFAGVNAGAYATKKVLRQHLNESQRAMLVKTLGKLPRGSNQHREHPPIGGPSMSQAEAATALNVSSRTIQRATVVHEQGVPELINAVKAGNVALGAAEVVATLTPAEQRKVVADGPDAVKEKARTMKSTSSIPAAPHKEPAKMKPCQKQPKNGAVKFDWKKFDEDFGRLRRSIDDIATAHADKQAQEYATALQQLEQLRQTWRAWQSRLAHGEAAA